MDKIPPLAKPVAISRMMLRNLCTSQRSDYPEVIMRQFLIHYSLRRGRRAGDVEGRVVNGYI